jgi:hypothetical protein
MWHLSKQWQFCWACMYYVIHDSVTPCLLYPLTSSTDYHHSQTASYETVSPSTHTSMWLSRACHGQMHKETVNTIFFQHGCFYGANVFPIFVYTLGNLAPQRSRWGAVTYSNWKLRSYLALHAASVVIGHVFGHAYIQWQRPTKGGSDTIQIQGQQFSLGLSYCNFTTLIMFIFLCCI